MTETPLVIRLPGRVRAGAAFAFAVLALLGIGGGAYVISQRGPHWALLALLFLSFAAATATVIWMVLSAKTQVFADRIAYQFGFDARELRRDGVRGVRVQNGFVWIYSRDERFKPIGLRRAALTNRQVADWLDGLVDLDAVDRAEAQRALETDESFGSDVAERRAHQKKLKTVAMALNAAAFAIGAWALLKPQSWSIAAAASLPLAALIACFASGGRFAIAIDTDNSDIRPSLGLILAIAAGVLALHAMGDVSILDQRLALTVSACIGICLAAALFLADQKLLSKRFQALGVAVIALLYGYGAFVEVDVRLDSAPVQSYPTTVRDKFVDVGIKTTRYEVSVDPWGPVKDPSTVDVGFDFYDTLNKGDRICFHMGPGFFRVRWYDAGPC